MPPRHGKSETISRLFTAYYLYRHPERWVGVNSYGASLAYTLSRSARDNVRRAGVELSVEGVEQWETTEGGGLWAAGVGGPITGKGFHLGVIDDPIKNAEESNSLTVRENHKDWYRSTFGTREEPGAAIVIVLTRWNEDDLAGWLLGTEKDDDEDSEQWTILSMEAIKTDMPPSFPANCTLIDDDRQVGEALCPERYDADKLRKREKRLGNRYWSALYQQNPSPNEGNIFKRHHWRYWQPLGLKLPPVVVRFMDGEQVKTEQIEPVYLPERGIDIQSWDCAFKDTKSSDKVAGLVFRRDRANRYMLDYFNERADINGTLKAIRDMSAKWPKSSMKLVEDKANGPAVITLLRNQIAGLIAVDPEGGKVSRAYASSPTVESGNFYLPHPALFDWVQKFIDNMAVFPNSANDDDVDAFTQAEVRMQRIADESMPNYSTIQHKMR